MPVYRSSSSLAALASSGLAECISGLSWIRASVVVRRVRASFSCQRQLGRKAGDEAKERSNERLAGNDENQANKALER